MVLKGEGYGSTSTSKSGSNPTAAPTNVQVVAPATLNEGYTFDAMYDGVTFTVTVPEGGVVKGQRFIVPFVPPTASSTAVAVAEPISADANFDAGAPKSGNSGGGGRRPTSSIPTGVWRDNLCDCCRFGPCHPHFLNAWLCRPILLGQILTRMKMTWLGERSGDDEWKKTFRNLVIILVLYFVSSSLTATSEDFDMDDDSAGKTTTWSDGDYAYTVQSLPVSDENNRFDILKSILNATIETVFGLYVFYILIKLRATLRKVYSIPQEICLCWYDLPLVNSICGKDPKQGICGSGGISPIGWEDICCAMWCPLCVVSQMARHTVDYDEKNANCCSNVGVEDWEENDAYDGVEGFVGEGSVLVV